MFGIQEVSRYPWAISELHGSKMDASKALNGASVHSEEPWLEHIQQGHSFFLKQQWNPKGKRVRLSKHWEKWLSWKNDIKNHPPLLLWTSQSLKSSYQVLEAEHLACNGVPPASHQLHLNTCVVKAGNHIFSWHSTALGTVAIASAEWTPNTFSTTLLLRFKALHRDL